MQDKNGKEIKPGDYFRFPESYGVKDIYGVVIRPSISLFDRALVNYAGPLKIISFEFNIKTCEKLELEEVVVLRLQGKL